MDLKELNFNKASLQKANQVISEKKDGEFFKSFVNLDTKANETDSEYVIYAYLSTFGNTDRQGDVIMPTAFDSFIANNKQIPMFTDHEVSVATNIGHWDSFKIDDKGLYARGVIVKTALTEHLIGLIKAGSLGTVSVGGFFTRAEKKEMIQIIDLYEASIVPIPANPLAVITKKSYIQEKSEVVIIEPVLSIQEKKILAIKTYHERKLKNGFKK